MGTFRQGAVVRRHGSARWRRCPRPLGKRGGQSRVRAQFGADCSRSPTSGAPNAGASLLEGRIALERLLHSAIKRGSWGERRQLTGRVQRSDRCRPTAAANTTRAVVRLPAARMRPTSNLVRSASGTRRGSIGAVQAALDCRRSHVAVEPRAPVGVLRRAQDVAGAVDGKIGILDEQLDAQPLRTSSVLFRFVADVGHRRLRGDPRPKSKTSCPAPSATSVDVLGVKVPVLRIAVPPMRGSATSRVVMYEAVLLFVVPSIACNVAPNEGNH